LETEKQKNQSPNELNWTARLLFDC